MNIFKKWLTDREIRQAVEEHNELNYARATARRIADMAALAQLSR